MPDWFISFPVGDILHSHIHVYRHIYTCTLVYMYIHIHCIPTHTHIHTHTHIPLCPHPSVVRKNTKKSWNVRRRRRKRRLPDSEHSRSEPRTSRQRRYELEGHWKGQDIRGLGPEERGIGRGRASTLEEVGRPRCFIWEQTLQYQQAELNIDRFY